MALTDDDGRYEFRELPAGRYSITASKTAFVFWSYGQTQPGSPGAPLVLGDNQTANAIDIRLLRGAVITGRISDEFGDPVPNASVMVMRQQFLQGQRRFVPTGGRATTDDVGEYRVFGLAPGLYYVSAAAQGSIGIVNGLPVEGGRAEWLRAHVLSGHG
jgi:protocatechuate 3,4-dioxygenase beta subunit